MNISFVFFFFLDSTFTLFLQQRNWDIVGTDIDAEFGCIFDTSFKGCGITGAAGALTPVNSRQ